MDDSKWERWGTLGGILFAVCVAITVILPGEPPGISDPAGDVVKFIVDKSDELRWSAYLSGVATIFLFWWLGSLWRLMRRLEGGSPRLAVAALAGGVFASLFGAIGSIILGALPIIGVKTIGAGGTRAFYVVATCLGFAALFGIAVLVGQRVHPVHPHADQCAPRMVRRGRRGRVDPRRLRRRVVARRGHDAGLHRLHRRTALGAHPQHPHAAAGSRGRVANRT